MSGYRLECIKNRHTGRDVWLLIPDDGYLLWKQMLGLVPMPMMSPTCGRPIDPKHFEFSKPRTLAEVAPVWLGRTTGRAP